MAKNSSIHLSICCYPKILTFFECVWWLLWYYVPPLKWYRNGLYFGRLGNFRNENTPWATKKGPWLVGLYWGWNPAHLYGDYFINHEIRTHKQPVEWKTGWSFTWLPWSGMLGFWCLLWTMLLSSFLLLSRVNIYIYIYLWYGARVPPFNSSAIVMTL